MNIIYVTPNKLWCINEQAGIPDGKFYGIYCRVDENSKWMPFAQMGITPTPCLNHLYRMKVISRDELAFQITELNKTEKT